MAGHNTMPLHNDGCGCSRRSRCSRLYHSCNMLMGRVPFLIGICYFIGTVFTEFEAHCSHGSLCRRLPSFMAASSMRTEAASVVKEQGGACQGSGKLRGTMWALSGTRNATRKTIVSPELVMATK